jgi:hypothetical protein
MRSLRKPPLPFPCKYPILLSINRHRGDRVRATHLLRGISQHVELNIL